MITNARINRINLLLLALSLTFAACATGSETARRSATNQLSSEELSRYSTVLEAVQALRANWLRQRTPLLLSNATPEGVREASPVWVYRDGTRVGDYNVLGRVSTGEVAAVEYFDAARASSRWGINHENGVIHLTSR